MYYQTRQKRQASDCYLESLNAYLQHNNYTIIACGTLQVNLACRDGQLLHVTENAIEPVPTDCPTCGEGKKIGETYEVCGVKTECQYVGIWNNTIENCTGVCLFSAVVLPANTNATIKCGNVTYNATCPGYDRCCKVPMTRGYKSSYTYFLDNMTIPCENSEYTCEDGRAVAVTHTVKRDVIWGSDIASEGILPSYHTETKAPSIQQRDPINDCNLPYITDAYQRATSCDSLHRSKLSCVGGYLLHNGWRWFNELEIDCLIPHDLQCVPIPPMSLPCNDIVKISINTIQQTATFTIQQEHFVDQQTLELSTVLNYISHQGIGNLYSHLGLCLLNTTILRSGDSIITNLNEDLDSIQLVNRSAAQCVAGRTQCYSPKVMEFIYDALNDTIRVPIQCYVTHQSGDLDLLFLHTALGHYTVLNFSMPGPQYIYEYATHCLNKPVMALDILLKSNLTLCGVFIRNDGFGVCWPSGSPPLLLGGCELVFVTKTKWLSRAEIKAQTIRFMQLRLIHHFIRPNVNKTDRFYDTCEFNQPKQTDLNFLENNEGSRDCGAGNLLYNSTAFAPAVILTPSAPGAPLACDRNTVHQICEPFSTPITEPNWVQECSRPGINGDTSQYVPCASNDIRWYWDCDKLTNYLYNLATNCSSCLKENNDHYCGSLPSCCPVDMYHSDDTQIPGTLQWVSILLPYPKYIQYIAIWNRVDCCQQRLKDYYILIDGKLTNFNDMSQNKVALNTTSIEGQCKSVLQITPLPDGRLGKNITLVLPLRSGVSDAQVINISEMQAFGVDPGASTSN